MFSMTRVNSLVCYTILAANNNGADMTALMRRVLSIFDFDL